jgi:uncharacterized protein YxeA
MKKALKILLFLMILFIAVGYIYNHTNPGNGDKFIGIGVLILAFVLMPLFLYHRYKGKDLSKYRLKMDIFKEEQQAKSKKKE